MTNKTKVVLGILGAVAAGIAIGMIVAPEKGSDMRKRIKRKTGTWIDGLGNLATKGGEAAKENISRVTDAAKERISRVKESM
ncbi:MAG: YtxH domain-containing protein [Chitinophagaceae bacterium]|nr:YtxH domain-containing protein [Chitinophagaceae bacterium]